ncbi:hypothetical protein [Brevundimonas goettingensis]|uniref:Uncharacterized protein n=1 Tax=Brevundimonas goettingensis TaxID=2774190 RepID=A0A975GVU2_9CAUL|nr:hypothetical protein [Brevundimonas goettingensis]QTC91856.1 hypothetical protein IFJ75_02690 [Brevundimonas goettingensis]
MLALALATSLAAVLATAPLAEDLPAASRAAPQVQTQVPDTGAPTDLGDIVVEGQRLQEATETFVREVGSPARGRGLARWRNGVCVGVVNLQPETAQYIVDRVSTVARDLGLRAGQPGCRPSVIIIATVDANAFTSEFVAMRPRLFIVGGSGMDQGHNALRRFQTTDRPVRWWNVSVPVEEDTGTIAVRLPGENAPQLNLRGAGGLLTTTIVDDSKRAFVIVDMDRVAGVSLTQLADYLAMVSLAQVNPDADTSGYATVLNLFREPDQVEGLTQWDIAYLEGLYDSLRINRNPGAARTEIASSIVRVHRRINRDEAGAGEPPAPSE